MTTTATAPTDVPPSRLVNHVCCNLCGADDAKTLFDAGVAQVNRIVQCNQCGLIYANPRIDADVTWLDTMPDDPEWDSVKESPQRHEKENLQIRDFRNTRALLNKLHPNRGKFVELGSSQGYQLLRFQEEGWDVLGVDPDRCGCRFATQKFGLKTIPLTLEAANLPADSADVMVMLHVIEHLPDPLATLREMFRVLKPGGHLVVETPRYDTLMFKLMGRRERSLSCDSHIYFFTDRSLTQMCEKAGFQTVRLDHVGRSLTLDRLAYNLGVMSKSRSVQRGLGSVARALRLQKLWLYLNTRDMQRIVVQKPEHPSGV